MKDFALYEKINELSDWLFPIVERWPKHEKFVLCTQTKNCVHDMARLSVRAQKARKDKLYWLHELDVQVQMLRHFLRHAHGRRYLSNRRLKLATERLEEIGRMVGGWIKLTDLRKFYLGFAYAVYINHRQHRWGKIHWARFAALPFKIPFPELETERLTFGFQNRGLFSVGIRL